MGNDSLASPPRPFASREHRGSVGSETTYVQRLNGSLCNTCIQCGKVGYPWSAGRKDSRTPLVPTVSNLIQYTTTTETSASPAPLQVHESAFSPLNGAITIEEPRRYATNANEMA